MQYREILKKIIDNVEKVIIGKRHCIELMVIALICEGHVLIEDVPGVGKTTMISALAKSLNLDFKRVQFTPDVMPSDITGLTIFDQRKNEFVFYPGSVMTNILLADEINRTSPKTQSSLLEVMQEKQVTVDGNTYELPKPFMVLATQNPVEYVGTYPLPEAQLDRFFMKIRIGYPKPEEEMQMLSNFHENLIHQLTPVVNAESILDIQKHVLEVTADELINKYIIDIVSATRNHNSILLGVSPRGSLALLRAAKAWALYQGRDYVIPDDVKVMAVPVLSHRIILQPEIGFKGSDSGEIIISIMNGIDVPNGL